MHGDIDPILKHLILYDKEFKNHVTYTIKTYHAQDKVLKKGNFYSYFCFLFKGNLRVVLSDDVEKNLHPIISDLQPNDIFGLMGSLTRIPANADVIATIDSEVVEIDADSFLTYIKTNQDQGIKVLLSVISILFNRINRMNEKVLLLLRQSIELQKKR